MTLVELLSSAVVSALVAGLVTLRTSERKIEIENITQERARWRDKIRENALLVHQAATAAKGAAVEGSRVHRLSEVRNVFKLLLNPLDDEDQNILKCIEQLRTGKNPQLVDEFSTRVAYLLKHDWERAKYESKPWYMSAKAPIREEYPSTSTNTVKLKERATIGQRLNGWYRLWLLGCVLILVQASWSYFPLEPMKFLVKIGLIPCALLFSVGWSVTCVIRGFQGRGR